MLFINIDFSSPLPASLGWNQQIPEALFAFYQMKFSLICPALMTGAVAERLKFSSYLIFCFIWSTVVCMWPCRFFLLLRHHLSTPQLFISVDAPICHQIWHPEGWLAKMGVLDFAGGFVVHGTAGYSAVLACWWLGKRVEGLEAINSQPHAPILGVFLCDFVLLCLSLIVVLCLIYPVALGTSLLWFGWFGFNGGSSLVSGPQAIQAVMASHLAAAAAGGVWMLLEAFLHKRVTGSGLCIGSCL